jgi:curved DNA-binding protein CbpA
MGQPFPPDLDPASAPSASAELLRRLRTAYAAHRSGHLHITHGRKHRGLALHEGRIVQARSDVAGEHLGDVLLRRGLVGAADLERAVAVVLSERRPLGAVVAELGLVDRPRLEEAVGWHAREILLASLEEPGGASAFEELESLPEGLLEGDSASPTSTGQILLDAARRLQNPGVVREALGDLDRKLVLATDPRLREHPVALTPTDGFVLSRIDGTQSVRELVGLIPLPPEETERSLLALLCTGAIVPAPVPRRAKPVQAPAPPPGASPAAPAIRPIEGPVPPPAPPSQGAEAVRRLVLEAFENLAVRNHFEVLGVSPEASLVEVRSAYTRLARTLHPDACQDPVLADVAPQRETVFMRVCLAYETLRDPDSRADYERDLRRWRPRPAPTGPTAILTPPVLPPPGTQTPPTPYSRAVPVLSPTPAAPQPSLEERLEETIATGERLLGDGHYFEAIQQIEPTLQQARGALGVRARLALAGACLKNPKWHKRAEAHLREALRTEPARVEAHLLLGQIYLQGGLRARAAAAYRKALLLQPLNREAQRELARLEGTETPPADAWSLPRFRKKR